MGKKVKRIVTSRLCREAEDGDLCMTLDGLDPDDVGWPPYRQECMCVVEERELSEKEVGDEKVFIV